MNNISQREQISQNWIEVRQSVHDAAKAVGRDPATVEIIGVTKYVDAETTAILADAGCHSLGENRPQMLWQKAETLNERKEIRWHLIGHLQRNKIRRLIPHVTMIHSIDSERLMTAIQTETADQVRSIDVLLEVNVSGEANKTGMQPAELRRLLRAYCENATQQPACVSIQGLMAMAGWETDSQQARRQFALARQLRDELADEFSLNLPHLSMGMSGDYAAAIAEGATMVRIGSALFAGII
ncbi:YggS family pyridoxal phosphate-dependent enzyme [Stieleria varia]|uniref:Pyridoxal phosphate homeostasis protein n=1 Tax=Stieleria varia TaxID=2528005 RepID=A0A5C6B9B0_9BACT|nr:YggS family pyridoxal phosphate-dependent enzyme [Stieleria varia]TWU08548.1 Pyridoxal phosphate homeostasis protein [Stieleria varia]